MKNITTNSVEFLNFDAPGNNDEITVKIPLQSFKKEGLTVTFDALSNLLSVVAKRTESSFGDQSYEVIQGRQIYISPMYGVRKDRVTSVFEDGVLTVTLGTSNTPSAAEITQIPVS